MEVFDMRVQHGSMIFEWAPRDLVFGQCHFRDDDASDFISEREGTIMSVIYKHPLQELRFR